MELPADLNMYAAAILFVLGAYIMAIYLGLIVWTFRDIRSRSRDLLAHILSTLLVAVFTLPGLLVYFLVRPRETLSDAYERALAEEAVLQDLEQRLTCPGCQRRIEDDYIICPHCQHQLRLRCVSCSRLLDPEWDVCPYCGHYHDADAAKEAIISEQTVASDQPELAFTSDSYQGSTSPVAELTLADEQEDHASDLDDDRAE